MGEFLQHCLEVTQKSTINSRGRGELTIILKLSFGNMNKFMQWGKNIQKTYNVNMLSLSLLRHEGNISIVYMYLLFVSINISLLVSNNVTDIDYRS